jgi:glycosyltransferase involved in cell wall biosynthesis
VRIAAVLPHVEVFGGVRRYLEIGNELVRRGHAFTLFHPTGEPPAWLPFLGETRPFSELAAESYDVGLSGEYSILPRFDALRARAKFFYFVLEGHKLEREAARRPYRFLGNSEGICRRIERKYGLVCDRAPGGVNPAIFHPLETRPPRDTFNILGYGRIYKRRKGVRHVIRAVEGLRRRHPRLKLLFFDSPVGLDRRDPRPMIRTKVPHEFFLSLPQDRMAELFSLADLFVSAERRAGWSNTTAEAMACGVPVVCTPSGTLDFAEDGVTALVSSHPRPFLLRRRISRLIEDDSLRLHLAGAGLARIREFTWARLADRLLALFGRV